MFVAMAFIEMYVVVERGCMAQCNAALAARMGRGGARRGAGRKAKPLTGGGNYYVRAHLNSLPVCRIHTILPQTLPESHPAPTPLSIRWDDAS